MTESLHTEINHLLANGYKQVTLAQFDAEIRAIGYRFDASMSCRSMAQIMTGPRAGTTYPAVSLYARQVDDGLSYCNMDARRDDAFIALKALRNSRFAVVRGAIATL
jgi:hypothetical protein